MTGDCKLCGSERDDCREVTADGIGAIKKGETYLLCPFCYTSSPSGMAEGYRSNLEDWKLAGRVVNYLERVRFLPWTTQQGKEIEVLRRENENLRVKLAKIKHP